MFPERLVTVRHYSSPEQGDNDVLTLRGANIECYLSGGYHRSTPSLRVPESQVEEALSLIGDDSTLPEMREELQCPTCGSPDIQPLPPYGLMLMVAIMIPAVLLALRKQVLIGFLVLVQES